jgi:hypothetical protein
MKRKAVLSALPFLIAAFLGALYFRTLAPGLTWANDGADGGDFLAALATGGVPHPGGYPTYMLLASLFAKIPFESLAFRINLFSCVCMTLALFFFYKLVYGETNNPYIASLASLVFGTFPLVWSQALITEVYALQTLLAILALFFLLPDKSNPIRDFMGGLAVGLALGNHLTSLFLIPFLFANNQRQKLPGADGIKSNWKPFSRQVLTRFGGFCLGLTTFLTIPIRAHHQSPVNWGNAIDWKGFWWLVSGKMYQDRLSHLSVTYLSTGAQEWAHFLLGQLGIWGLGIGLVGLVILFRPSRFFLGTVYLAGIYSLFSIVYFSPDSYVYLIPVLMVFAIWIGMGLNFLLEKISVKNLLFRLAIISIPILLIASWVVFIAPTQDLSNDHGADQYAQFILTSLPDRAIVITKGDEALFSLWYFHYANHQRPDIVLISGDLISQAWYRHVLKSTYPDLNIPDNPSMDELIRANWGRPICRLKSDLQPAIECIKHETNED